MSWTQLSLPYCSCCTFETHTDIIIYINTKYITTDIYFPSTFPSPCTFWVYMLSSWHPWSQYYNGLFSCILVDAFESEIAGKRPGKKQMVRVNSEIRVRYKQCRRCDAILVHLWACWGYYGATMCMCSLWNLTSCRDCSKVEACLSSWTVSLRIIARCMVWHAYMVQGMSCLQVLPWLSYNGRERYIKSGGNAEYGLITCRETQH